MSFPPDHSTAQYAPPPDRVPPPAPQHILPNSTPWWRRTWVIAAAALVVGAGIAGAVASGGSSKTVAGPTVQVTATATVHTTITVHTRITATVTPTKVVATDRATAGAVNDGRYLVGSGIQPGTYHTDGNPVPSKLCEGGVDATCGCSYTRLSNLSGDPRAIIASNLFVSGPTTIKVEPTDYALQLFGGCEWAKIG